ncbi:MAG: tryptophan synthase subunit alpha, partial [Oligoflexales bacterium]|nr:tryptophan synthase subunit alpha [Oligoflexales bacterium]
MTRISERLAHLREKGKKAFVAYITGGDPDMETSEEVFAALVSAGVDIMEIGVPFSDPVGDGPTNQLAAERALMHGTSLDDILAMVSRLRLKGFDIPVVLFTYFNPLFNMGIKAFADKASKGGVDGVLVVDLPPEEADEYLGHVRQKGIETIFLASPTTHPSRIKRIDEFSSAFVYYVSRLGVTGAKSRLSDTLEGEIMNLKQHVSKPIIV